MALFRPIAAADALFLGSVGLLVCAVLAHRLERDRVEVVLGTLGWTAFTLFWAGTAAGYLVDSRYFLGSVGAVTVGVSAYAGSLLARSRSSPDLGELGIRLTLAFAVMGVLFSVFEFVDPVHRLVLNAVAAHTAWGLSLAGFSPIVPSLGEGYANAVFFRGMPLSHSIELVSACSGISAICLFVGLIAATDAPRRRKVLGAAVMVVLIYLLNVIRAVFVAGAMAGQWFAFAKGFVGSLFGVTDPAMASYYFAEYFLAQALVVVVLLWVYFRLAERMPEVQSLVESLLDRARSDFEVVPYL